MEKEFQVEAVNREYDFVSNEIIFAETAEEAVHTYQEKHPHKIAYTAVDCDMIDEDSDFDSEQPIKKEHITDFFKYLEDDWWYCCRNNIYVVTGLTYPLIKKEEAVLTADFTASGTEVIKYLKGEKFMKKLPELYKNLNSKPKDNNKKVYYMENDIRSAEKNIIEKEIENIFNTLGYSYNIPVEIKTTKEVYHTSLVSKTKENVLTLDNQIIPIKEIIQITRK